MSPRYGVTIVLDAKRVPILNELERGSFTVSKNSVTTHTSVFFALLDTVMGPILLCLTFTL